LNPESLFSSLRTGLTPFLGLPLQVEPGSTPGVVLGAPFDGGVINRPGARLGPWALRHASLGLGRLPMPLRLQGQDEGGRGFAAVDWVDGGNLATLPFGIEQALAAVEYGISQWAAQGARTLMLGGDHSMTLGALRAHAAQHGPLGLLVLDAHPDAGHGELWGSPMHHGTWLRQALEEGVVEGRRCAILGLRAPRFGSEELAFLADRGAHLWTPWDLRDPHLQSQLYGDLARVGQGPAYVSIDLDAFDPSHCPAVAEPVPAGLTVAECYPVFQAVRRWSLPWVGADVMELAATLAGTEDTARVGVHVALQLLA
jgi:arginase family enzyme